MNQTTASAEAINSAYRKFCNSISPELKQRMNGRMERGLQIALSGGVAKYNDPYSPDCQRLFKVNSSDPAKPPYLVNLESRTCTCPDHWKGHYCKHRVAAQVIQFSGLNAQPQEAPRAIPPNPIQGEQIIGEPIIWACLRLDGKAIGIEVLGIESDLVRVQALPTVTDGGKLEPQFPFPNGNCSCLVQAGELFHIRVYRNG